MNVACKIFILCTLVPSAGPSSCHKSPQILANNFGAGMTLAESVAFFVCLEPKIKIACDLEGDHCGVH